MTGDWRAFYVPDGRGRLVPTTATVGPWSSDAQHAGPPSALLARAALGTDPDPGQRLGRLVVDVLRPVPVRPLTVRCRTVRPGRRVTLLDAVLEADGVEVALARAWRLAEPASPTPRTGDAPPPPLLPPAASPVEWTGAHHGGYLDAVEWRFHSGGFDEPGPARAWARPRVELVEGEFLLPELSVVTVADSGSGVSGTLEATKWAWGNVDLHVVFERRPTGPWTFLDAATTTSEAGTGTCRTGLADPTGFFGTATQTLVITPSRR